jgi:uncharacterized protein with PIN domain
VDIFAFALVRDGVVPSVFVPRGADIQVQLAHVLRELSLPLLEPRCMACGGALAELKKEDAEGRVPERSLACHERFWVCLRCERAFWHGTHWKKIEERLKQAVS